MNNVFAYNRNKENEFLAQLSPRIAGICLTVMRELLIGAAHTPGWHEGIYLKRGEICISQRAIRLKTGLSRKNIRTALEVIKKLNESGQPVANQVANRSTVHVLVNYDTWDGLSRKGANQIKKSGQQVANRSAKGPTDFIGEKAKSGQPLKEVKEVKEVKEPPSSTPRAYAREEGAEICSEKTRKAKDDFETDMVAYWTNHIAPELPIPWPQFDFWRKHNSEEVILCATLHMASTGKSVKDPLAYLPSLFPSARQNELSTQRSHTLCQTDSRYQVQSDTPDFLDDLRSEKEKTNVAP